jgi:hypothetical protein
MCTTPSCKSCKKPVIDLLALFNCEHISRESSPDGRILECILKMDMVCRYMSRRQLKKYKEILERLLVEKTWGGSLARLLLSSVELSPCKSCKDWAEEVWRGGRHRDEYADIYAGILSRFGDCSADCAIICTAEASEEQFEELLRKLSNTLRIKPEYEYICDSKVLLKKT